MRSASPLTPLDYIAEGYWQDFLAGRPIASGLVYETELAHCQLDESLASLQRVDTLITQIRRDLTKAGTLDERSLLSDERYRNLLVFLGFYAGRVLAQQWHQLPHWYGHFELTKRYPALPLLSDVFYHHMAVSYRTNGVNDNLHHAETVNSDNAIAPVFFVLEPIGLRLFGHIDRPFMAVQGGQIASGLYQAVMARLLPQEVERKAAELTSVSVQPRIQKLRTSTSDTSATIDTEDAAFATTLAAANTSHHQAKLNKNTTSVQPIAPDSNVTLTPKILPTPKLYLQLLDELKTIEVPQTAGHEDYQKACNILDQFEHYIAKQQQPRALIMFSSAHQDAKQHALTLLKKAANSGHTSAMLRLAMYELLGEDKSVDDTSGVAMGIDWVKQAANKKDSRAQRLLSKLYYQGIGLSQDINSGQYWLEQAADNGHQEAVSLVAEWQQSQTLRTATQQNQRSIQRYQWLIVGTVVLALMIAIVV